MNESQARYLFNRAIEIRRRQLEGYKIQRRGEHWFVQYPGGARYRLDSRSPIPDQDAAWNEFAKMCINDYVTNDGDAMKLLRPGDSLRIETDGEQITVNDRWQGKTFAEAFSQAWAAAHDVYPLWERIKALVATKQQSRAR